MKWRLAGSALLLAAALSGAGAQQSNFQPDPLAKLDLQTRAKVQGLIDSARGADLPWNALRLKAIEGVRKNYSNKDVLEGTRRFYRQLELSKAALGPMAGTDAIEAGASVLAVHVSTDDLTKFRVTSAGRSPMVALVYLADLIDSRSVPRDDAIEAFTTLWKDGAAESDIKRLWQLVDQDILGGVNPRAALQSRMRSLPPRTKPPGEQDMEYPHS